MRKNRLLGFGMFSLFTLKCDETNCDTMAEEPEFGLGLADVVVDAFRHPVRPILSDFYHVPLKIGRRIVGEFNGIFTLEKDCEVFIPPKTALIMVGLTRLDEFADYTGQEIGGYLSAYREGGPPKLENSGMPALTPIWCNTRTRACQLKFGAAVNRMGANLLAPDI